VGRHAQDAAVSVATEAGVTLEEFQAAIIMRGGELQRQFQQVLRDKVAAYRRVTEPHILARKPFDPEKFLGKGWKIVERVGQRSGSNLDVEKIVWKDYLKKGESHSTHEERLWRIKANPKDTPLDEQDFLALYAEEGQLNLRWLYDTKGIIRFSFCGFVLQTPNGSECALCLGRHDDSSWGWFCGGNNDAGEPVAVLES